MAHVTLEGVKKTYADGLVAVHDVDLDIADGELVAIVGPSGCGKTTMLRLIAGLESVTAGRILIDGRVMNDVPPAERDIAMVFQGHALYPHMSVRRNMGFALELGKRPKKEIEKRVRDAAAMLGLESLLDRPPRELTVSQRQRVAIGRALVREPRVFLFDEPLSNLDAKHRGEMRRELAALHRRLGTTMIHVTHDQVEAMTLGDRIVVMSQGRVRQVGTPTEVYDHPADTFVATFLGNPPMNLLYGAVDGTEDAPVFRPEAQPSATIPLPPDLVARAQQQTEHRLLLGVRPEFVHVAERDDVSARRPEVLTGTVELIEPLGHEQLLHLRVGDAQVAARMPRRVVDRADTTVVVRFEQERLQLFDAVTGVGIKSS